MQIVTPHVEKIGSYRARLGESVVWSARDDALLWVDIEAGRVLQTDLSSGATTFRAFPQQTGFVHPTSDGTWLVGQHDKVISYNPSAERAEPFVTLEPEDLGNRTNDATCDRAGNLWVGTMNLPGADDFRPTGSFYRIDGAGAVSTLDTGLYIPNGVAFSPDGTVAYWADTYKTRRVVWQADYDAATGRVGRKSVFFQLDEAQGRPDGATVDAAGCYWIAAVRGWQLLRFTPGGELDLVVRLPVERPTKLAFGGSDLNTIFISTISAELAPDAPSRQPLAGHLLAIDLGIEGLPTCEFHRDG